jgi:hypothetical protein
VQRALAHENLGVRGREPLGLLDGLPVRLVADDLGAGNVDDPEADIRVGLDLDLGKRLALGAIDDLAEIVELALSSEISSTVASKDRTSKINGPQTRSREPRASSART